MTLLEILLIAGALLAFAGAFFLGSYFSRKESDREQGPSVTELQIELARIQERDKVLVNQIELSNVQVSRLRTDIESAQSELTAVREKLSASESISTELRGQIERAGNHITSRDELIENLRLQIDESRAALSLKDAALAAAAERETALNRQIAEKDEQLKEMSKELRIEFENIANRVLTSATGQLADQSGERLNPILDPLKAEIKNFKEEVDKARNQAATLTGSVEQLANRSQFVGQQAENLAKALTGDSRLRGQWAQRQLRLILEKSGLQEPRDFVEEGKGLGMKSENGGMLRPDFVVFLPPEHDGYKTRHIVIDSKLSLVDYAKYDSSDTEEERDSNLRNHVRSVRNRITELANVKYQFADAINSHEFVLMFVRIEDALILAIRNDDTLLDYAWDKRIIPVSPSTLFLTMQTVASIWNYERQTKNAEKIFDLAAAVYDKLAGFVQDLNTVAKKLDDAVDAHRTAMKKLSTGRGNALSLALKLKEAGAKPRKELPEVLFDGEAHEIEHEADAQTHLPLHGEAPQIKLLEQGIYDDNAI